MRVAFALVAASLAAPIAPAFAADWYTGAKPQSPSDDWVVSVNTSVDITSQNSRFGDISGTFAPSGSPDRSGPRARIDALGGTYSYRSPQTGETVHGAQESGAALLGYEWITPDYSAAAFLGGDIRNNTLSIADPENPVVGTTIGAKGSLEFSARPSALTAISGYASYATNKTAYFTRLRGGYLVGPGLYVGPEVAALGDAFFNQERIGFHLSGFHIGALQFAIAGGYLNDRVRKGGAYATLDAHVNF